MVVVRSLFVLVTLLAARASENILYQFAAGQNGAHPGSVLLVDGAGDLFGTAPSGGPPDAGTVFELKPPAGSGGAWSALRIYAFNASVDFGPYGALVHDANGNLYGTTIDGGAYAAGAVFQLTPPVASGDRWTFSVLHSFGGARDGARPYGNLILDRTGKLYGTTWGGGLRCGPYHAPCGTAFRLAPPAKPGGSWRETILHAFKGHGDGFAPFAGLVADAKGNLFGTTIDGGAFGFGGTGAPPRHSSFTMRKRPPLPLPVDLGGTVFALSPPGKPGGAWTESVLHSFGSGADGSWPYGAPLVDRAGNVYGTTVAGGANLDCGFVNASCGIAFRLTPPQGPSGAWMEQVILDFPSGGSGGFSPYAGLLFDSHGNLFGTTWAGGPPPYRNPCAYGCGTVFELSPPASGGQPWNETVLYGFRVGTHDGIGPLAPLAFDAAGNLVGSTQFGGIGNNGIVFEIASP